MGKPAARVGDSTAHGGVITGPGQATVLIGGMPASIMNDMHVCPAVNPGVPPPPHVGGQIIATAATVLIGGQPAARMGDTAICSGPPATIVMGCTTVLIGDGGGGGGGGGGGTGSMGETEGADSGETEAHFLDVKFVDGGGFPVGGAEYTIKKPDGKTASGTLAGRIKQSGVEEGDYEISLKAITKAEWSAKKARDGETVKMTAEGVGFDDDAKATFEVWERDINRADRLTKTVSDVAVSDGKAEAEWQYEWIDEEDTVPEESAVYKYSQPAYYFIVKINGCQARSPILAYKDYVEIEAEDGEGNPLKGDAYRVFLASGEVREGKLDGKGYAKIENVPPGKWDVEFPDGELPHETS